MKRKICAIIMALFVMVNTMTIYSLAGVNGDTYESMLIKQRGYTEQDIMELKAIQILSDVKASGYIVKKYEELGDWKKVREYYKVDEKKYESYMLGKKLWQETLDKVPDYIFEEMKDKGWTERERDQFVSKLNIYSINYEYAWTEIKTGRTIGDIIEERKKEDEAESKLMNEFVYRNMTTEEYRGQLLKIFKNADTKRIEESVVQAETSREQVRTRHKKQSGISDEEIEFCKSLGITNPMDMYQGKSIAVGNNLSFEDVIKTFIKVQSWSVTIIELMDDVTPESYIALLQDIIDSSTSEFDDHSQTEEKIREIERFYGLNGAIKETPTDMEKVNDDKSDLIDIADFTALFVGSNKAYVAGTEKLLDANNSDVSVFVEDDRLYVPVRFISENNGGKVEWIDETQTVNIVFEDRKISLTIGKREINVNGKTVAIDVAPVLENERTFLPLRACVDALGKDVLYSDGLILISDLPLDFDEIENKAELSGIIQKYFK